MYGLQAQGLDGNEPLQSIEEMAAHYIRRSGAAAEGPYYMGGLSFGGMVAFEMARQWKRWARKLRLLAVLDAGHEEFQRPTVGQPLF